MDVLTGGPLVGQYREKALAFLRSEGYLQPIQLADAVYAVWLGAEVVGTARIASEEGALVLRGMRVRKDMRRRGIGRQLLVRLGEEVGQITCWCIPHRWLADFYGDIGFKAANPSEVPPFLLERHARYREQGLNVIIMVRRVAA